MSCDLYLLQAFYKQQDVPKELIDLVLEAVRPLADAIDANALPLLSPSQVDLAEVVAAVNGLPGDPSDLLGTEKVELFSISRPPEANDEQREEMWRKLTSRMQPWTDWTGPIGGGGAQMYDLLGSWYSREIHKALGIPSSRVRESKMWQAEDAITTALNVGPWFDRMVDAIAGPLHGYGQIIVSNVLTTLTFLSWLATAKHEKGVRTVAAFVRLMPRMFPLGFDDASKWVVAVR